MKNTFKIVVVSILIMALTSGAVAMAEIDLSGLNYDELVELKDRINKAMWESEEWQEVEVPQGVWKVGEDIPAGHWTVKPSAEGLGLVNISIGNKLEDNGKEVDYRSDRYYSVAMISEDSASFASIGGGYQTSMDFEFMEGEYVCIEQGRAIFTPYSGKPSLGFK